MTASPEGQNEQPALVNDKVHVDPDIAFVRVALDFSNAGPDHFKPGYLQHRDVCESAVRLADRLEALAPQTAPDQQGATLGDARGIVERLREAWPGYAQNTRAYRHAVIDVQKTRKEAADLIERLTTAPQPQGWQSMDSAPRDGTRILARGRNWGDSANPFHVAEVFWTGVRWSDANDHSTEMLYLTNWLPDAPLPAPPTSEQSA